MGNYLLNSKQIQLSLFIAQRLNIERYTLNRKNHGGHVGNNRIKDGVGSYSPLVLQIQFVHDLIMYVSVYMQYGIRTKQTPLDR